MTYLMRLLVGGSAAILITTAIGVLIAYLNGFIITNEPTSSVTPCYFGDMTPAEASAPRTNGVTIDCVERPENEGLFTRWIERFTPSTPAGQR